MQSYTILLLVVVLVASVAAFCVVGLRQRRRWRVLEGAADEMGLEFSATDMYDLPLRFNDLVLIGSGHSRLAYNIASGRVGRWRTRVFDFQYEVGHGVRRSTCYYSAAVVELSDALESVLMWHEQDLADAPLAARGGEGRVDAWTYEGGEATAHALARACAPLADVAVSMQLRQDILLLCCPARRHPGAYARLMACLSDVLTSLTDHEPTGPAGVPA